MVLMAPKLINCLGALPEMMSMYGQVKLTYKLTCSVAT